jgi:tripartite-type tricarboxylate transporter receptor subunit TctC
VINVHTYRHPPYDPARDFTAIGALAGGPTVLAVPASAPYRSARDLVAALRRAPGALSYGSGGKGSIAHLAVEMLLHQGGTRALHVPYKGATELVAAMLSGQTDFGMPVLGTAAQYLHNGQLRALAVSSSARSPYFPEVPTLAEALPPGFAIDNWSGLFAPAGLPAPLLQRIFAALGQVQASGAFDTQLRTSAGELRRSASPGEFNALVAAETRRYGALMREIGMDDS